MSDLVYSPDLYDLAHVYNVLDFGTPVNTSRDCSASLQSALTQAYANRVPFVWCPPGNYVLQNPIVCPDDVGIIGGYRFGSSHSTIGGFHTPNPLITDGHGTIFDLQWGQGNASAQASFTFSNNSGIDGVALWQSFQAGSTPTPAPYAIALNGNEPYARNIELWAVYQGINAQYNQRALIEWIVGQPLAMGIYLDDCHDVCRIVHIHFNPWCINPMTPWSRANGTAMLIGRADSPVIEDFFALGYNIGIQFIEATNGHCYGLFTDLSFDHVSQPLLISALSPSLGLRFQNVICGIITGTHGITINGSGPVHLTNLMFSSGPTTCDQCISQTGTGTTHIVSGEFPAYTTAAIDASAGTILATNCAFGGAGKQVILSGSASAIVSSSLAGAQNTTNTGTGTLLWANNL